MKSDSNREKLDGPRRILVNNRLSISDGSVGFDTLVLILFAFSVYLTPIFKKNSVAVVSFGCALAVFFVARYGLSFYARMIVRKNAGVFLWAQLILAFGWSISWGLYNAYALSSLALGWTSYFLTVATLAISASSVLLNATSRSLMILTLLSLTLPSVVANIVFVPGLRGQASWMLLVTFSALLLVLGLKHHKKVTEVLLQRSRMAAILEAIPGAICWFDFDKSILGGNSWFFSIFTKNKASAEIISLSDQAVDSNIKELAEQIFSSSQRVNCTHQVGEKSMYMAGQKYRFGEEALIVGIDITAQESLNQELEKERKRSYQAARTAEINQLLQLIVEQEKLAVASLKAVTTLYRDEVDDIWHSIAALHRAMDFVIDDKIFERKNKIDLSEVLKLVEVIFKPHIEKNRINLVLNGFESGRVVVGQGSLLLCLSILIHNSVHVLMKNPEIEKKTICISAHQKDDAVAFHVEDNGPGIDEFYSDMIFEPFVSSNSGEGTGLGLALLNEIVYSYGGTALLESAAKPTRFVINFPCREQVQTA